MEEVRLTKEFFGFDPDSNSSCPDGVREHFAEQTGRARRRPEQGLA